MILQLLTTLMFCGLTSGASCQFRCHASYDPSLPCQCNQYCEKYKNCCVDYNKFCKFSSNSCTGRCREKFEIFFSYDFNSYRPRYGDCCNDYRKECTEDDDCSLQVITDDEILQLSDELYLLDINRAKERDIIVNIQSKTIRRSETDVSTEPFFSYVNPNLMRKSTYAKFIALLDNYEKVKGINEVFSDQQLIEQDSFLDEVLETDIGTRLFEFFAEKNILACGSKTKTEMKQLLKDIWFGLYSRKRRALDSSGFEHVFVGEVSRSSASGLHNWIQIYREEELRNLNYFGYLKKSGSNLYGIQFEWFGRIKQIAGPLVGCSPEYQLAISTLCHIAKPDRKCRINLRNTDGSIVPQIIQTWTWKKSQPESGRKYIASAYFTV